MARKTETVTEPAKQVTRQTALVCDMCGKKSTYSAYSWGEDSYDANETKVEHRSGSQYPEGGCTTTTAVDLCPTCFETKLIPWLEAQGCQISRCEDEN